MDPISGATRLDDWFVLLDPAWEPPTPSSPPPAEVIVGGWMVDDDGDPGPFQPNPSYVPASEATPTDPTDALLRRIGEGASAGSALISLVRNSVVELGCDEHDQPMVDSSPDGVSCVLVATAELQKLGVPVVRWWPVLGSELPGVVPPGTDILLNLNGHAPFRLSTDALSRADRDF